MAAAVLALAGCGGGGDGGISREEWAEQADEICTHAKELLLDVALPGTLAQVPTYVRETTPIIEQELEELRALERPPEHAAQIERMIAAVERVIVAGRRLGAAAEDGDDDAARAAGREAEAASRDVQQIAGGLGADGCAEQGTSAR